MPDLAKVVSERFANADDDIVLVQDVVAALVSVGVLPFYANWIASGLAFAIENNQSTQEGSLPRIASGKRGSDPFIP